jgi:maleylacetoacetate isomerase
MTRILYGYFRSSAAWRVRIALHMKGLDYKSASVHLVANGGEQHGETYKNLNPQELVPFFIDGDVRLSQSMAIIEYLDEVYSGYAILQGNASQRAQQRSMAQIIASDVHPLDNLRVLQYLEGPLGVTTEDKNIWYHHWIKLGFASLEAQLSDDLVAKGLICDGLEQPGLAELCLVPQVYNAHRFKLDMSPYPRISALNDKLMLIDAFAMTAPEGQADAV